MVQLFNDSDYAKRDMSALWMEILDHIYPVLDSKNINMDHVKMALYSGHDSTLAPLMASLGRQMWNDTNFPYYASMMVIEVRSLEMAIDDIAQSPWTPLIFPLHAPLTNRSTR